MTRFILSEDIEIHDTLNPKLWDVETEQLKPEVEEKINQIVDEFLSRLEKDGIKMVLKDVILIGSNCSYNYNKDSDLDIHLSADTTTLECPDNLYPKLYSAYRSIFNSKLDIEFYGIPVEIFVDTEETPTVSSGIYSVRNKEWINKPERTKLPEIDPEIIKTEFAQWEDRYNDIVSKVEAEKKNE